MDALAIARQYAALTIEKRQHEAAIAAINAKLDQLKEPLLAANAENVAALYAAGKKPEAAIHIPDVGKILFSSRGFVSGDQHIVAEWLDAAGLGDFVPRRYNSAQLGAYLKAEQADVPDFIGFTVKPIITFQETKGKGK